MWAVTVAHFCFNWGYYTLLAWLPSYFELALGLNVEKSSFLTLIPYIAMTCMNPFVGPIADGWVRAGVPLTRVRKICQVRRERSARRSQDIRKVNIRKVREAIPRHKKGQYKKGPRGDPKVLRRGLRSGRSGCGRAATAVAANRLAAFPAAPLCL